MLESRYIIARCEHCQESNEISLRYFVGHEYKFEDQVVAMCRNCKADYLVTLDMAKVQ